MSHSKPQLTPRRRGRRGIGRSSRSGAFHAGHCRPFRRPLRLGPEHLEDRRLLASFPVPLSAVAPLGSLIHEGVSAGEVSAPSETDTLTIDLDAGQTVTVMVEPGSSLQPIVGLSDPAATVLGTAVSGAPGEAVVLQAVAARTREPIRSPWPTRRARRVIILCG